MSIPSHLQRYSADLDRPHKDEKQTADAIAKTMTAIADKTFADGGHALRSVHAKSHGILKGSFEVFAGLPGPLAQGLFAKPSTHPVVMRFSTIPGDLLDDSISTPRGLAIKIIGVDGRRLENGLFVGGRRSIKRIPASEIWFGRRIEAVTRREAQSPATWNFDALFGN